MHFSTTPPPTAAPEPVDAASPSPATAALAAHVQEGLGQTPKSLSSKYFYDEVGSRLFQQIMDRLNTIQKSGEFSIKR